MCKNDVCVVWLVDETDAWKTCEVGLMMQRRKVYSFSAADSLA